MRDDRPQFFVSLCVADGDVSAALADRLEIIASQMESLFHYWEMLLVLDEGDAIQLERIGERLAALRNLRIIEVVSGTGYYRRRLTAASEAIGDIVVLADAEELEPNSLFEEVVRTYRERGVAIGYAARRATRSPVYPLLSILSEHIIDPRITRTLLVSRNRLTNILSRQSGLIDLRFEPRNGSGDYRRFPIEPIAADRRRNRETSIDFGMQLVMSGAPRYLKAFAGLSMLVFLASICFAVYAVAAYALLDDIQPGWFSSSFIQAGSVGFISLGMTVFSLALAAIHERQNVDTVEVVVRELGNTSFFERSTGTIVQLAGLNGPASAQVSPS